MFRGRGDYDEYEEDPYEDVDRRENVRDRPYYKTVIRAPARKLAKAVGEKIGGGIYDLAAGGLASLKSYIGKLIGSGDYRMGAMPRGNVLTNSRQIPKFATRSIGVTISHREYLGDLISSSTPGAFKIQSYALNPGLDGSFPWLSGIAANFQQYRWNGVVYEFRSMSSDALNSTNTALGTVTFSTDYDSSEPNFRNKQEMENTEYSVSCKPSVNMMHGIECAKSQTTVSELYVRTGDPPSGYDKRLYDLGFTSIATQGCQGASVNLGEIWVTYSVSLFKPIQQPQGVTNLCAKYRLNPANATAAAPLMLTGATVDFDNIGLSNTGTGGVASGLTLVFPQGTQVGTTFRVQLYARWASSATNAPPPVAGFIGCTQVNSYDGNTVPVSYAPNGNSSDSLNCKIALFDVTFQVTTTVLQPQLIVTAATYGATPSSIDLQVDQLNSVAYSA